MKNEKKSEKVKQLPKVPKKKKEKTLEKIPLSNSPERQRFISFIKTWLDEKIAKTELPFFSEKELQEIENETEKFKKQGGLLITEIESLITKKWDISSNTIKQYIQKGLLPRAKGKVKTKIGAVSIYPLNFIRHLNFVRICLHFKMEGLEILKNIAAREPNDFEVIATQDVEGGQYDPGEFEEGCFWYFGKASSVYEEGLAVMQEAIEKAFPENNSKRKQYLDELKKIENLYNQLSQAENSFIAKLKGESQ